MSQRAISKMENNEINNSWDIIEKIAKIMDVDPVDIVTFDENFIFNNCYQSGKLDTINNSDNSFTDLIIKRLNLIEAAIERINSRLNNE
jgi:transcriptional regulator with XRE-family HTH domain